MLIITHECNLNCTYCYEKFKGDGSMSLYTAKRIILQEVNFVKRSDRFNEIEIDFMGGEPLMNFSLIREVVEWMEISHLGVPFITGCATNGTLLNAEMREWMPQHNRYFLPGLSYDGNSEMQRLNRGDKKIDVDFFINIRRGNQLHITISRETLKDLAIGVLDIQRRGGYCTCALAQGACWSHSDAILFRQELKKLASAYYDDQTLDPLHFLTRPLYEIGNARAEIRKYCGTGDGMATYDIDGSQYPCHMFSPLVMGTDAYKDLDVCSKRAITDPYCCSCVYQNWCPTCYGFNLHFRGNTAMRDHNWCEMVDVWAKAACEFQLKYYDRHRKDITSEDGKQIRAAIDAYRILKKIGNKWRTDFKK